MLITVRCVLFQPSLNPDNMTQLRRAQLDPACSRSEQSSLIISSQQLQTSRDYEQNRQRQYHEVYTTPTNFQAQLEIQLELSPGQCFSLHFMQAK